MSVRPGAGLRRSAGLIGLNKGRLVLVSEVTFKALLDPEEEEKPYKCLVCRRCCSWRSHPLHNQTSHLWGRNLCCNQTSVCCWMTWRCFRRALHRHGLKAWRYLSAPNAVPSFDVTSIKYDFQLAEDSYRRMETNFKNTSIGQTCTWIFQAPFWIFILWPVGEWCMSYILHPWKINMMELY